MNSAECLGKALSLSSVKNLSKNKAKFNRQSLSILGDVDKAKIRCANEWACGYFSLRQTASREAIQYSLHLMTSFLDTLCTILSICCP